MPKTATFSFTTYTDDIAGVFAKEWCRRMQFFFTCYLEAGVGFKYTQGHVPPEAEGEFKTVLDTMGDTTAAGARARELVAMRPCMW